VGRDTLAKMPSRLLGLGSWVGVTVLLVLLLAAAYTWLKRRQEVDAIPDQRKIARTLEIIRADTPTNHKVLKVLFYGQSITRTYLLSGPSELRYSLNV
jgi:hypothetical protein